MRLLQIKCKEYKGFGPVYNFMLEEILDYGPSNLGKFGSTYKPTIELFYNRLKDEIFEKRRQVIINDLFF